MKQESQSAKKQLPTVVLQVASMLADVSSSEVVVPGTEVNGADDMTGDLELDPASVLYVSGEESVQQVPSLTWPRDVNPKPKSLNPGPQMVATTSCEACLQLLLIWAGMEAKITHLTHVQVSSTWTCCTSRLLVLSSQNI